MLKKSAIIFTLLLSMTSLLHAERYLRWNSAGYFPSAPKRIVVLSRDECKGCEWTVKDSAGATVLSGKTGESVCGKSDHTPFGFNYEIPITPLKAEGTYAFELKGTKPISIVVSKNPFGRVIESNLRWIRVMRAGYKNALDRKPGHFGDSACYVYRRKGGQNTDPWEEDKNGKKVSMVGGWYDGFEYTKNTQTAALTTYALLRAWEQNSALFTKKYSTSNLVDILDEAAWGLDYLCKTMPDKNEFIISVGDFNDNNRGSLLPEEDPLNGKRPAYSIYSPTQMGLCAAALALGSSVFSTQGKADDAKRYRDAAIKIFAGAIDKNTGSPAWLQQDYSLFEDETPADNLLLGAAELYRLTKAPEYLALAKKYAPAVKASYWASYSSVNMQAHLRLAGDVPDSKKNLLEDLNGFRDEAASAGNLWCMPQDYSGNHCYAVIEVATATMQYDLAGNDTTRRKSASAMLDYLFGTNNWGVSFVSAPYIKNSVRNYYSQIYMLQKRLFPEGGIAMGPIDKTTHETEGQWGYFDAKAQPTVRFNTPKVLFIDQSDDYNCMGASTYGVAEGILLFSAATRLFGDASAKTPAAKTVVQPDVVAPKGGTGPVYIRYNQAGYVPQRKKMIVIMAEKEIKGVPWTVSAIDAKGTSGKAVLSGAIGASVFAKGDHTPMPFNYTADLSALTNEGAYSFELKGTPAVTITVKKDPYTWLIEKTLHWMRAARCGSADCVDRGPCHYGDTACEVWYRDGLQNSKWSPGKSGAKYDLSGGWHDAGDYLKFSLTVGYTAYFLLRAYEVDPGVFTKKMSTTGLVDILDEAKWGLDFLVRCMPDTSVFIIMAGGLDDHNVGLRLPQDDNLDGKRPCFSALSPTQMGYTAAALALGSVIFDQQGRTDDARRYREAAIKIFRRAESKDAVAPAWFIDTLAHTDFYADESKNDNMELAAVELFRLTKDQKYFQAAKKYADKARAGGWRAWESVNIPAHLRLMEHYAVVKNDLCSDLDGFLAASRKPGNVWGLPQKYVWGGLYCVIGIGAGAMEYQMRTGSRTYEQLGIGMLDYFLGCNNWGIAFVAAKELPYTITQPFSQVYTLQSDKFPAGAISEGPGDKASWEADKKWFGCDPTVQPTYKFNTDKGVFFDFNKDYMCMETTIAGVADGIYFLACAARLYDPVEKKGAR